MYTKRLMKECSCLQYPKLESPINKEMDIKTEVSSYNVILLSKQKELITDMQHNMNESQKHHVK